MDEQLEKFNILIVDDRKENLLTLESIINHKELNIIKASSGNEALALMLEYPVSLVLMDVNMPDMDGFETAELMRGSERTKGIPIIFITASYRQPSQIFRGYETGAIDYLYKPLDRQILQSKIRAYISFFKQKHALEITHRQLQKTVEELNHARKVAETATRLKSAFIASMSHEIRTPLSAIIGMTDLVLMDEKLPDQFSFHLNVIKQSSLSLLNIINEILDISKIEADKVELEHIPFSIREVIEKAVRLLSVKTFEKKLDFICIHPPSVPDLLHGDPTRLRQVLINLLGNAIKFTEQGSVTLAIETVDESDNHITLKFSVSDTGIGIPQDKIGLLFEQYQQAGAETTRQYGGTGLGLAISKRLVELMGGTIAVSSEHGKGTTFSFAVRFSLPQKKAGAKPTAPTADFSSLRALVIGKRDGHTRQLCDFLKFWHISAETAFLSEENTLSQETIPAGNFNMVFLDYFSPSISGSGIIPVVRSRLETGCESNLAILTFDKSIHASNLIESCGIRYHLYKPVLQADLFNLIRHFTNPEIDFIVKNQEGKNIFISKAGEKSLNILLAEDQLINQKIVVQLLAKRGWSVTTAVDGKEAVEKAGETSFDVILMDVQMPLMDGYEATRIIRSTPSGINLKTPIIALTANAMKGDRERCIEAGMNDYISKPISPEELIETIQKNCFT